MLLILVSRAYTDEVQLVLPVYRTFCLGWFAITVSFTLIIALLLNVRIAFDEVGVIGYRFFSLTKTTTHWSQIHDVKILWNEKKNKPLYLYGSKRELSEEEETKLRSGKSVPNAQVTFLLVFSERLLSDLNNTYRTSIEGADQIQHAYSFAEFDGLLQKIDSSHARYRAATTFRYKKQLALGVLLYAVVLLLTDEYLFLSLPFDLRAYAMAPVIVWILSQKFILNTTHVSFDNKGVNYYKPLGIANRSIPWDDILYVKVLWAADLYEPIIIYGTTEELTPQEERTLLNYKNTAPGVVFIIPFSHPAKVDIVRTYSREILGYEDFPQENEGELKSFL